MRKLKLELDSLVVETFETGDDSTLRGTVEAYDSWETTGGPYFCPADCGSEGCSRSCLGDCYA